MVEAVFRTTQALADGGVSDFELGGGDAAVVVTEAEAVIAPDERGAARTAPRRHAWPSFSRFGAFAGFGSEPVERARGGGEGAAGRNGRWQGRERVKGRSEAWGASSVSRACVMRSGRGRAYSTPGW